MRLEHCIGPFCAVLENGSWPALPMPDHMIWFAPQDAWSSPEAAWTNLFKFQAAHQLTAQLELRDPLKGVTAVLDTRSLKDFRPPKIFLAFAWKEKEYLERVAGILFDEGRQFWALTDDSKGVGSRTIAASKAAVDEADAVILLASRRYVEIYNDRPDGPIHGEVSQMLTRVGRIPIVPLALDAYSEIAKLSFPWGSLGQDGKPPFMGLKPLKQASSDEFRTRMLSSLAGC